MQPEFRILGPLEVALGARLVSPGGRRERAILGILLLHAGEVVSVERLIDGVWGEARPASAKHMIHEYVSRLRLALGESSSIATRPPGYMVELTGAALDAREFGRLTAAARTQPHAEAIESFDRALALWRGAALADAELEGHAQTAATRLDQERWLVGEERIDCALALGRHVQLIPELEHRVELAPLRERARAQLMLALYRAGRQTDALERYREGRALLVEQTGVEPGRELRELERAILTQDPSLELEPGRAAVVARPPPSPGPARRTWRRAAVAALLFAAAAGTLVFVLSTRSGSTTRVDQIGADSAGAIDPGTNRLIDQVRLGAGPGQIAAGFASLWVVNSFDDTVSRIDPATGTVEETIQVGGEPTAIAVGAGFVWVACDGTRSIDKIDPQADKRVQRVTVGNGPSGIAIHSGALWVTDRLDDTVTEIDAKTGTVLRVIDLGGSSPSAIVYGFGALWVANESSSTVTRLDPATKGAEDFNVGNGPEAIAVGDGAIWVANSLDGTVSGIDPTSRVVTTFTVGPGPSSVLVHDGSLWVADSYGGRIVRVDPTTHEIVRTIRLTSEPQGLAASGGRIWLSSRGTATAHRGGTLRLFDNEAPDSLDESTAYLGTAWSALATTGDGLVGFKRVGGLDGGTLVPDLATALSPPTNGGRTYTFQLRRGVHYSNGDPVRASDVRRALERDIRINPPAESFDDDFIAGELVGGGSCTRSHCDLARGVVTNDREGTVVLNLRRPDANLDAKLALPFAFPVPPGFSMTRPARLGVPGTGPYMIRSYLHQRLVLVRNPHFREWSAAAQPSGYPDRIVATYNAAIGAQLTAVEQGSADLMAEPPASRLTEITTRYASRVHVFPGLGTISLFLNTQVPPFDSLAARQAVSFAIDRSKAVAGFFGGALGAVVTCQILPPGMAGYRRYCPFTHHATANGLWSGPDLSRARDLVAASGTSGEKIEFLTGPRQPQRVIGQLAAATLRQLGYRVELKVVPDDGVYFATIANSRNRVQAGFVGWSADFPSPANFLALFACSTFQRASENNVNYAELCDRPVDRAIAGALRRQTTDSPARANASWSALDRRLTKLAAWVPLATRRDVAIVSRRAGNVQSNPQWGVLIDQIWVR
jgi:peptide/nickel transport system substrate-binding protein